MRAQDVERLLRLYEQMLLIRRVEERLGRLFADGKIPGFVHLSIGQESIPAGVCAALHPGDTVASTHRGHGHALARGMPLDGFFAEIMGRETGICRGRGGSIHVADMNCGMLGANGIVGGGMSIALGSALAHQVQARANVSVAFFGDGAMSEGVLHECLNLSSLWKLPLLLVCENNGWSEFSQTAEQFVARLEQLAGAFGITYYPADGRDVTAVFGAADAAAEAARAGAGPALIECFTHRWRGHYEGDPQRYRQAGDKAAASQHDPLQAAATTLQGAGVAAADLDQVESQVMDRIESAVAGALEARPPDFAPARADVYGRGEGVNHA